MACTHRFQDKFCERLGKKKNFSFYQKSIYYRDRV